MYLQTRVNRRFNISFVILISQGRVIIYKLFYEPWSVSLFLLIYMFIMTQKSGQGFLTSKADKVEYSVKVRIKNSLLWIINIPHLSSQQGVIIIIGCFFYKRILGFCCIVRQTEMFNSCALSRLPPFWQKLCVCTAYC